MNRKARKFTPAEIAKIKQSQRSHHAEGDAWKVSGSCIQRIRAGLVYKELRNVS